MTAKILDRDFRYTVLEIPSRCYNYERIVNYLKKHGAVVNFLPYIEKQVLRVSIKTVYENDLIEIVEHWNELNNTHHVEHDENNDYELT
jgi:hypothetical protein